MSGKRRIRPGSASLLAMMVFNAVASVAVLYVVYAMFGLNSALAHRLSQVGTLGAAANWETLLPLVPGAAIGFALLWFCQVIVGRSRGVHWPGAFFYGMGIALGDVLLGGLINGSLHGSPLIGLLLGLLMLILVPANLAGMLLFGAIMGLINGRLAHAWIARYYPRP
jgi:hypothetical protein